ncbi:MAG TPA: hypothetical protein VGQ05_23345 [Streptosporangiaceae bacterium]|nr:hypothetical protein [Streptosporangiaceae bacterium]
MTIAAAVLSLLLAAEFTAAPVNLWTGRTIGNFTRYTGLPPRFATQVLAPVKLAIAVALIAGLAGLAGFAVFGALAVALLAVALLAMHRAG